MSAAEARIQVGGTLIPNRHVYIARAEDERLFELLRQGQFCNVLTSRQMGKSSLMMVTARRLRREGIAVATVDIAGEVGTSPHQEEAWRSIADKIASDLRLEVDVSEWWDAQPAGTNNRKLLRFFRDVVGGSIDSPVVVFLDEIDATLRLPYTDDLFTALRTIYNERGTEPAYERLTFCIVGVATPNELVKDLRTTAYNIGVTIPLHDFEAGDDLSPLLAVLRLPEREGMRLLERILYWTDGHPYLTLKFCNDLAGTTEIDVDAYASSNFANLHELRSDTHFEQILRFLSERLTEGDAAVEILDRVIRGERVEDRPALAYVQLKLSGLVKVDEHGLLVIRNRIYKRLFDVQWLRTFAPRRRITRLKQYAVAATVLAGLLIGAWSYYRVSYLPSQVAAAYTKKLQEASTLADVTAAFDVLDGHAPDPVTGITLSGGDGTESNRLYSEAEQRWIGRKLTRAQELIKKNQVEEALVLGAYVAVKTGRTIDPSLLREYEDRGYEALITTLRSGSIFDPGLAVSPDGTRIAVGNIVWREMARGWLATRIPTDTSVNVVAFGPAGVYTGDDAGSINVWTDGKHTQVAKLGNRIYDLAVAPDGRVAAIEAENRSVTIVDGSRISHYEPRPEAPTAVAFAPNGAVLAITTAHSVTVLPRGGKGKSARGASAEWESLEGVTLSADGWIALADVGAVRLFDEWTPAGRPVNIAHQPLVRSVAFSGTGRLMATASDEGVRIFDMANGFTDLRLPFGVPALGTRSESQVQAVAFDEPRNRLVVRRKDALEIWDARGRATREAPISNEERLHRWQEQFSIRVNPADDVVAYVVQ